jgi:hypothetical protein
MPAPTTSTAPHRVTPDPAAVGKAGAAAILGVSISWIEHHLDEVPSFHLGRRRMFLVDALRDWIREQATAPAPAANGGEG